MLAGFGKSDITPLVGTTLTGYLARLGPAIGVRDHLFCRARVVGQGSDQAGLLVADTLGFGIAYWLYSYMTQIYEPKRVRIQGKLIGLMRRY